MKLELFMKTIGSFLMMASLATASDAVFASNCSHATNVTRGEIHQINVRVDRINHLAREAQEDQRRVDAEVRPRLVAWNHTMKIHEQRLGSLRQVLTLIQQVSAYLEEAVSSDLSLKLILDQIRTSQRLSPDRRLAEQLRILAQNSRMRSDARESLSQFTKTVELLEKTHAEFAAAEVQLIEDYLKGRNTLVNGMLDAVNNIAERLNSDLLQAEAASDQDRLTTADLVKQLADEKDRQKVRSDEILALSEANAASKANMENWKPKDHCVPNISRDLEKMMLK